MNSSSKFLFKEPPPLFSSKMEAAVILCTCQGKFLLLKTSPVASEPGLWSAPGGKLEKGETPHLAAKRELFEETGLHFEPRFLGSYFARKGSFDFRLHLFHAALAEKPSKIVLNPKEHDEFEWLSLEEALQRPLMVGANECFAAAMAAFRLH